MESKGLSDETLQAALEQSRRGLLKAGKAATKAGAWNEAITSFQTAANIAIAGHQISSGGTHGRMGINTPISIEEEED